MKKIKKAVSAFLTVIIAVTAFVVPAAAAGITAPAKVTATAKSSSSVKVAWSKVDGAAKYVIYYSTDAKTFKTYGSTKSTSATVKKLTADTKYYFRVKSVDSAGNKSSFSKTASAVTAKDETDGVKIEIISAPGRVKNGKKATLKFKAKPNTTYKVSVQYKTKASDAKGVGSVTTDAEGYATITWKVGTNTTPGTHPILISGDGQKAETSFETYKK